jgi:hypothetical protein
LDRVDSTPSNPHPAGHPLAGKLPVPENRNSSPDRSGKPHQPSQHQSGNSCFKSLEGVSFASLRRYAQEHNVEIPPALSEQWAYQQPGEPDTSPDGIYNQLPEPPPGIFAILKNLSSIVRNQNQWMSHFPEEYHSDIAFLITHESGKNLASHSCMGASHTDTHRTADHTRGLHINFSIEIAIEMAEHLGLSESDARDLVIAVAVHDQGHIFASHQSETAINSFQEYEGTPGNPKFCHEHRTKELLNSDDFVRHFGKERIENMKSVLYNPGNPMHMFIDWADRLAYLIADSIHLGHEDLVKASSARPDFIRSMKRLDDGSIALTTLDAVSTLIDARDLLYKKVSEGPAATLFKAFLIDAYHRAVAWQKKTPTEFVNIISQVSTPQARELFYPEDRKRLYCPQQAPELAVPVDRDHTPVAHVTLDMLSPLGRQLAREGKTTSSQDSTPGCKTPRAGMSIFESTIRNHFATITNIPGYLEKLKVLIGVAHMPQKRYHLQRITDTGSVQPVLIKGQEHWALFVATPQSAVNMTQFINTEVANALKNAGLIDQTPGKGSNPSAVERLLTLPRADLFTNYK